MCVCVCAFLIAPPGITEVTELHWTERLEFKHLASLMDADTAAQSKAEKQGGKQTSAFSRRRGAALDVYTAPVFLLRVYKLALRR